MESKVAMNQGMNEEEDMVVNYSFERYRKALIRAARDNQRNIALAENTIYILKRVHEDNMIDRWISTAIAVSGSKENLMAFCRKAYIEDITFDEHDRTSYVDTDMGKAYFEIREVASV